MNDGHNSGSVQLGRKSLDDAERPPTWASPNFLQLLMHIVKNLVCNKITVSKFSTGEEPVQLCKVKEKPGVQLKKKKNHLEAKRILKVVAGGGEARNIKIFEKACVPH